MGCCFCPSFSSSKLVNKAPLADVYISPLPKSLVFEAQPAAAQSEIQPISQTQRKIQIVVDDDYEGIKKRVQFASKVTVLDEVDLKSVEADSKQSSGEGESYESLFSLQLVDGWKTANEEEVMSKEISSSINASEHLVGDIKKDEDEGFTFPSVIQLKKGHNADSELMQSVVEENLKGESVEVSVDSSLSSWLVEPENNTPMSANAAIKSSATQRSNGVPEKRRVLGELCIIEVHQNLSQSLKSSGVVGRVMSQNHTTQAAGDSGCGITGTSKEIMKHKITRERSSSPKQDQRYDLQRAIPMGLRATRAAMFTGMV